MVEYTLKLNSEQCAEVIKAVDLLLRLKINQPKEITWALMWPEHSEDEAAFNERMKRRDKADEYLLMAFNEIFPIRENIRKDEEWYTLYNIKQALRYQRHLAEFPDSTGVDSYPPFSSGGEPVPECTYEKKEEKSNGKVRRGKGH